MLNPLPDALHFCSGDFVLDVTLSVLSVTFLLWCSILVEFTLTVCVSEADVWSFCHSPPYLLRQGLSLRSSLIWHDRLVCKLRGSACICLPNPWVAGMHHCAQLQCRHWGSEFRSDVCMISTLLWEHFKNLSALLFLHLMSFSSFFEVPFHFLIDIFIMSIYGIQCDYFLACCHVRVISIPAALAIYPFLWVLLICGVL